VAKILVVDDDETTRRLIRALVAPGGHVVVEADSGRRALECFSCEGDGIDLVLSDVDMPDGDGLALHEALADRLGSCQFVLMTGNRTDDSRFDYAHRNGVPLLMKGSHSLRGFFIDLRLNGAGQVSY